MYNILLGGAAGDGIETTSALLEKMLKRAGQYLFAIRDSMSRIRGGHNFVQIRFGSQPVMGHSGQLDVIVATNRESVLLHLPRLAADGIVLCGANVDIQDKRIVTLPVKDLALQAGNPKAGGSVFLGALLKIFSIPLETALPVLEEKLPVGILQPNEKALQLGYDSVESRFTIQPVPTQNHILTSGAGAISMGALAGGLRFYSAYPMSPSTSILEYLSNHSDELGIAVEQAEDEIAAVNMALGASYAGAKAMVATSGGGFCLMVEALGFAGIAELPIVIADMQRPGPATGLPTRTEQSDLRFVISASQGEFPRMVIALRNHEDAYLQTARAFDLAEKYQIPVILLGDQYLADSTTVISLEDILHTGQQSPKQESTEKTPYLTYRITESGISPRLVPGKTSQVVKVDSDEHDESGVITELAQVRVAMTDKRMRKLASLESELQQPMFFGVDQPEVLLVGFGSTLGALQEAVENWNGQHENNRVAGLSFGDIFPLPTQKLMELAKGAKYLINVEQNATGQLGGLIREVTGLSCNYSIVKYDGRQIAADEITMQLKDFLNGGKETK